MALAFDQGTKNPKKYFLIYLDFVAVLSIRIENFDVPPHNKKHKLFN